MEYVDWVKDHWTEIMEIWGMVVLLASAIIRLVPKLPEGHWALPLVKFVAIFVALNRPSIDQRPKSATY